MCIQQPVSKLHYCFPQKPKRIRVRVLKLARRKQRCKDVDRDLELKNLKLYIENMSIMQKNEKLRKQADILHQENQILMSEFQNRFSKSDSISMTSC